MASIEKRSDTTYRITVSCGYDKLGKKQFKKKTVSLEPTLTEKQKEKKLNELAVLFEKEVENGTYLDGEKITFEEFINKWLVDYAEKQLAPGTLRAYKMRLNHRIIPALGSIRLTKIQPHHLLEFYNNLAESGMRLDNYYIPTPSLIKLIEEEKTSSGSKDIGISPKTLIRLRNGEKTTHEIAQKLCGYYKRSIKESFTISGKEEKLSSKMIKSHHDLIYTILDNAVEWGVLLSNPAERVKTPKAAKKNMPCYDDEQIFNLLSLINNAPIKYKSIILLTIDTGLRLSDG